MSLSTFPTATLHPDGFYEIEVTQLRNPRARVVDVRELTEHADLAPLSDAVLVPLGELVNRAQSWNRDEPLIIACRSGARSGRAAKALTDLGFHSVVSLRGGMHAYWQLQGN